jgi:hypothetical protein
MDRTGWEKAAAFCQIVDKDIGHIFIAHTFELIVKGYLSYKEMGAKDSDFDYSVHHEAEC